MGEVKGRRVLVVCRKSLRTPSTVAFMAPCWWWCSGESQTAGHSAESRPSRTGSGRGSLKRVVLTKTPSTDTQNQRLDVTKLSDGGSDPWDLARPPFCCPSLESKGGEVAM